MNRLILLAALLTTITTVAGAEPPKANKWVRIAFRACEVFISNGKRVKLLSECNDQARLIGLTETGYVYDDLGQFAECAFNGVGAVRRDDVFPDMPSYKRLECHTDGSAVVIKQTTTSKHADPAYSEPTLIKDVETIELVIAGEKCELRNYSWIHRDISPERYLTNNGSRIKVPADETDSSTTLKSVKSCRFFASYKPASETYD